MNLYVNQYTDKNVQRNLELVHCLLNNVDNGIISRIFAFTDDGFDMPIKSDKITQIIVKNRPTYRYIFSFINDMTDAGIIDESDVHILSNSDIYFDNTLFYANSIKENDCFALSRWDVKEGGNSVLFDAKDSQDTWIFRGKIKNVECCDFTFGVPGCDNSIAYKLDISGYNVTNPSKSIVSHHLHLSDVRNYSRDNTIQPPYKLIEPTQIIL